MTVLVCDSSVVVALLLDDGPDGRWAARTVEEATLIAPSLMPFEATNIIRRQLLAGLVSADQASAAHADLLELTVELWPYDLLAARVWELRSNLTSYDAAYVALAETAGARVVTLDRRLSRSPGLRCVVETP